MMSNVSFDAHNTIQEQNLYFELFLFKREFHATFSLEDGIVFVGYAFFYGHTHYAK